VINSDPVVTKALDAEPGRNCNREEKYRRTKKPSASGGRLALLQTIKNPSDFPEGFNLFKLCLLFRWQQ
jgi:hypothetical protein